MGKTIAVIVIALLVVVGVPLMMSIHYHNAQIESKNLVLQKQTACEAHFDMMWKSIQQVASVPEAAKESFKAMYEPLITGRYAVDSSGPVMKWIKEENPTFDWSLYKNVQSTIEAQRISFFKDQEMLLDVNREYKNLIQTVPGSWFLDPTDTILVVIITSDKTEDAYKTGKENDIDIYGKKK